MTVIRFAKRCDDVDVDGVVAVSVKKTSWKTSREVTVIPTESYFQSKYAVINTKDHSALPLAMKTSFPLYYFKICYMAYQVAHNGLCPTSSVHFNQMPVQT